MNNLEFEEEKIRGSSYGMSPKKHILMKGGIAKTEKGSQIASIIIIIASLLIIVWIAFGDSIMQLGNTQNGLSKEELMLNRIEDVRQDDSLTQEQKNRRINLLRRNIQN